jgi:hypothetical protein
MLRIKKQYLNSKVSKGQDEFILLENSNQQTLQYLYNIIGSEYIEFIEKIEQPIESPLPEIKIKKNDKSKN